MSIRIRKLVASLVVSTMLFSLVACDGDWKDELVINHINPNTDQKDDEDDNDEEDSDETTETSEEVTEPVETSQELTYPDHEYTYEEIHPTHENGTVSGEEASGLLDGVEKAVIANCIQDYADAAVIFENPDDFGIFLDDVTWGDCDLDSSDNLEFAQEELNILYTIDATSLDEQDKIFYDKIVYDLEEEVYTSSFTAFNYMTPVFNSFTSIQCEILFVLDVFEFDTVEDAENYILLLEDIDRYFDGLCACEEQRAEYGYIMSDETYEEIAVSFDNLAAQDADCFLYDTFKTRLDNIDGLSDADRTRLISDEETAMHETVFPEFTECASRMRDLEGNGGGDVGLCSYLGGQAYYSALFRSDSNCSEEVMDVASEIETSIQSLYSNVITLTMSGDASMIDEYMNHDYSVGDTQANLALLSSAITPDYPAIPEHTYTLMNVPDALADNFSPAAYLGYHLDNFDSNLIITNTSAVSTDFGLTCAHEGYPGHMYQSIYTRSIAEHPYMYISSSTGYNEGWAQYVQCNSAQYFGASTNAALLVNADSEINILLMARMDIGINYEGWSLNQCATELSTISGIDLAASDLESAYKICIADPCYPIPYGVGYFETASILNDAQANHPNATALQIHQAYLDAQTGTYEQIRVRVDENLAGI